MTVHRKCIQFYAIAAMIKSGDFHVCMAELMSNEVLAQLMGELI